MIVLFTMFTLFDLLIEIPSDSPFWEFGAIIKLDTLTLSALMLKTGLLLNPFSLVPQLEIRFNPLLIFRLTPL